MNYLLLIIVLICHLIRSTVTFSEEKKPINPLCTTPNIPCVNLPLECFTCRLNASCIYGDEYNVNCKLNTPVCIGKQEIIKTYTCAYCYQLPISNYVCGHNDSCKIGTKYRTTCNVNKDVLCLGHRSFNKKVDCNYSSGFRWTTTLILSIALGGFGVDRFYLGSWQEGIGKLFSFGGLGVWTLIDAILIAAGYLKPGDSRYS